jgi:hypothetical protein
MTFAYNVKEEKNNWWQLWLCSSHCLHCIAAAATLVYWLAPNWEEGSRVMTNLTLDLHFGLLPPCSLLLAFPVPPYILYKP